MGHPVTRASCGPNLWYKYDDDTEWKTTNRLDLLAEKEANNLKVLGRVKLGLPEPGGRSGLSGRRARDVCPATG